MKYLFFSFFFILQSLFLSGQDNLLNSSPINRPYQAEMFSPISKIEFIGFNKFHPSYYKNKNAEKRIFNEIQTGMQIPLFAKPLNLKKGELVFAITFPLSAVLLIDMYETETAPVINNDYRFGWELNTVYSPDKHQISFIKNYSFTIVPVFHESTHIGDEYSIHGYLNNPDFKRINVSYEAWQLFAGINKQTKKVKPMLSAELGYQRLMPYKNAYYNIDSAEVKGNEIILSNNRDIWLLRAELQIPLSENKKHRNYFISTEFRRDLKFGYSLDNPEQKSFSVNLNTGIDLPVKNSRQRISIYLRYFRGVMPYGQLRDTDGLSIFGFGISFF